MIDTDNVYVALALNFMLLSLMAVGGANVLTGALRVALWSALAMGVTAGVGALFGTAV